MQPARRDAYIRSMARSTGLFSGLLGAHEGEHRVVNDVVAQLPGSWH